MKPIGILGGPGIGKSTIAQALMRRPEIVKRFRDDILFVRCDAVRSAEILAQTLCRTLGVEPTEDESARLVFVRELKDDPTLIIVDNLETPWESDRENVEDLLQHLAETPNVSLVVTMRGNEPPSGANWGRSLHVPTLDLRTARRLFLDRSQEAGAIEGRATQSTAASPGRRAVGAGAGRQQHTWRGLAERSHETLDEKHRDGDPNHHCQQAGRTV